MSQIYLELCDLKHLGLKGMLEHIKKSDTWTGNDSCLTYVENKCLEYSSAIGESPEDVLLMFEHKRDYSFPNFYQRANQPSLKDCIVYKTIDEAIKATQNKMFLCPRCGQLTTDGYECNSGFPVLDRLVTSDSSKIKICDWKAYGLIRIGGQSFICIEEIVRDRKIIIRQPFCFATKEPEQIKPRVVLEKCYLIRFRYDGYERVSEPHYGFSRSQAIYSMYINNSDSFDGFKDFLNYCGIFSVIRDQSLDRFITTAMNDSRGSLPRKLEELAYKPYYEWLEKGRKRFNGNT